MGELCAVTFQGLTAHYLMELALPEMTSLCPYLVEPALAQDAWVLVNAANGGTGRLLTQLLKGSGAVRVLCVSSSPVVNPGCEALRCKIRSYLRPKISAKFTDFRQLVRARSRLYRSRFLKPKFVIKDSFCSINYFFQFYFFSISLLLFF